MSGKEEFIYTFHFVDGKKYEHRNTMDDLTDWLMTERIIEIDNALINMDNVVRVVKEKQSDRDKANKDMVDSFTGKNFYGR